MGEDASIAVNTTKAQELEQAQIQKANEFALVQQQLQHQITAVSNRFSIMETKFETFTSDIRSMIMTLTEKSGILLI